MAYKKNVLAKFPSRDKSGRKKSNGVTKINDKRKKAIDVFKPHPPANNGWWYYELFSRDAFNRNQNPRRR
tara:strand:- start:760 stop:969 length:210 start_codon:yes stop_codon:yes gene_type:complete